MVAEHGLSLCEVQTGVATTFTKAGTFWRLFARSTNTVSLAADFVASDTTVSRAAGVATMPFSSWLSEAEI